MKISTPLLLLSALATTLFTACSDKEREPAPADPAPAFALSSYFDFTTPTPAGGIAHYGYGTGHSSLEIKGTAMLNQQRLVLDFAAGSDEVHFEVNHASLGTDWTNTYALQDRSKPNEPVFVSYIYNEKNGPSYIYRLSESANELTGHVAITAYDAKRQLISGSFQVRAPKQRDPQSKKVGDPACTILLDGTFEDLKVKRQ